ncbi:hypothetical protein MNBD_ALPHA06-659 [hydrothermal vent metagenome]|uniref:Lipoprotein n=1 Tax=hydrothermal vent metagenome TaxID=652676 RepID=A0A3B0RC04_9ZZZZ
MRILIFTAVASLVILGCSATTQTTSGKDYLARYSPNSVKQIQQQPGNSIDQQVRQIAAVEPDLRFPARIGLARISDGQLSVASDTELEIWADMVDKFGPKLGSFVPVSPLIAAMVRPAITTPNNRQNVINDIRRGAARQHLDYVLAYEVISTANARANMLSIADLSVIGLFILPSRNIKVEATASAILLDVRNGYPYGTASSFADKTTVASLVLSHESQDGLTDKASMSAVIALGEEVEVMFTQLLMELAGPPKLQVSSQLAGQPVSTGFGQ